MEADSTNDEVAIAITMRADVAYQLAQFCKRSTFDTFFELTENHLTVDERTDLAYKMIAGIDAVAIGLRKAGFAPR